MASWREKLAAAAGMSLKEYIKTSAYKKAKSARDDAENAKKDQKKAEKQTSKYYKEKKGFTEDTAETSLKRLQEDLNKIYEESGIAKTRALEDYTRNIGNIEQNKAADVDDLNYYVSTAEERTGEDLDTALAKESRRYELEADQINQTLADQGMTFSDRTPEKIAQETSRLTAEGIQTEANRSFADISRYEATKNRDIELKYGQQQEVVEATKTRTLEDIIREQQKAVQSNTRTGQDVQSGLKQDLSTIGYEKSDALSDIANSYTSQEKGLNRTNEEVDFYGN